MTNIEKKPVKLYAYWYNRGVDGKPGTISVEEIDAVETDRVYRRADGKYLPILLTYAVKKARMPIIEAKGNLSAFALSATKFSDEEIKQRWNKQLNQGISCCEDQIKLYRNMMKDIDNCKVQDKKG